MPPARSPRPSRAPAPIRYRVAFPDLLAHELEVTMEIPAEVAADGGALEIAFPVWAPGSYMVRDFPRHVYDLTITDRRGRPLPAERLDKGRWRISHGGAEARVRYRVFAFEQTVRTSHVDDRHAYFNGTSVFFFVDGAVERPCEVEIAAPRGWHVSTALPAAPGGRTTYAASSYDELVDSPFEIGTHEVHAFRAGRCRFEVALYGRTNADVPRLLRELKKIVTATAALFGGFPFDRYLFIIHALPSRGGGLEHANSTTLDIAGLAFEDEAGYRGFAELAAHEFFHAWNVKRIHDRVLGPFDYTRENYTRLLWFHEGFTEYMEAIILLRAGLLSPKRYLEDLADEWKRYVARPGRNVTPLSELSFEAWVKLYKPADNHTNRTVSYYEKGKWAGLVLELMLREATGGRRGVPELFERLWARFGSAGRPLTEAELHAEVDAVAGRSMAAYFSRYIHGVEELPVPALLRRAGIAVKETRAGDDEEDATKRRRARGWVGVTLAGGAGAERPTVKTVVPGSPAWKAGLTYGDELVAIGELRATPSGAPKRFADHPPGARVKVAFFRQDLLREATVIVEESPERELRFALEEKPSAPARAIRRGWLGA
jgi:predicted metalloprotease with PDZ domain